MVAAFLRKHSEERRQSVTSDGLHLDCWGAVIGSQETNRILFRGPCSLRELL